MDNGLTIPAWSGRRRAEALRLVKAIGRRTNAPCCICDQPIDYSLEYPDPWSCSVQHLKSRFLFPALTWDRSNWAPAHISCNKSAGAGEASDVAPAGLGVTSDDW
ncbi:hypothetical protein [Tersicoccus sp. Bi-70]|uniref:hypothetical protein n=1 Tax=Tersicoccus sp. Bi-70 TaxID=1897634 RepID=UPI00117FAF9B|nr:hypothetical protein [Tersicoccus sp. Bi-70]